MASEALWSAGGPSQDVGGAAGKTEAESVAAVAVISAAAVFGLGGALVIKKMREGQSFARALGYFIRFGSGGLSVGDKILARGAVLLFLISSGTAFARGVLGVKTFGAFKEKVFGRSGAGLGQEGGLPVTEKRESPAESASGGTEVAAQGTPESHDAFGKSNGEVSSEAGTNTPKKQHSEQGIGSDPERLQADRPQESPAKELVSEIGAKEKTEGEKGPNLLVPKGTGESTPVPAPVEDPSKTQGPNPATQVRSKSKPGSWPSGGSPATAKVPTGSRNPRQPGPQSSNTTKRTGRAVKNPVGRQKPKAKPKPKKDSSPVLQHAVSTRAKIPHKRRPPSASLRSKSKAGASSSTVPLQESTSPSSSQ